METTLDKTKQALKYIRAIRNEAKRDYATRYAIWLARDDRSEVVSPVPFHLTYMGAQAIRMRLDAIWKES